MALSKSQKFCLGHEGMNFLKHFTWETRVELPDGYTRSAQSRKYRIGLYFANFYLQSVFGDRLTTDVQFPSHLFLLLSTRPIDVQVWCKQLSGIRI